MNTEKKLIPDKAKGFTLIELLVVISIIGILISLGVAAYSSAQKKARNSRRMQDMKAVQNAAEQFYGDNTSSYPFDDDAFTATYLPAGFPNDPKCPAGTCPAGFTDYSYVPSPLNCVAGACTSYYAGAKMEDGGGNANASCVFGAATYFCVKNLQ